jgi:transposase-like protein
MTWRETDKMDERLRFVAGYLAEEETMSALCEAFGIARKTGYKWLERCRSNGVAGLCDLARAPHFHGRATADTPGAPRSEVWRGLNGAATLKADCGKIVIAVSEDVDPHNADAVGPILHLHRNASLDSNISPDGGPGF